MKYVNIFDGVYQRPIGNTCKRKDSDVAGQI